MWGCFPFLTGVVPGRGYLPPPLEKKCKLHAEKIKFGVYFASYEVAYINEHRLVDGVWRLGGGRSPPSPPSPSSSRLWIRHCRTLRAMLCTARCFYGNLASPLCVRLSVTLMSRDRIIWNIWRILHYLVGLSGVHTLSADPNTMDQLQKEHS